MKTEVRTKTVLGRSIALDNGAAVFLGRSHDHPNLWFFGFRNEGGDETKLTISNEAVDALLSLHRQAGELPADEFMFEQFPQKLVWRLVEGAERSVENEAGQ